MDGGRSVVVCVGVSWVSALRVSRRRPRIWCRDVGVFDIGEGWVRFGVGRTIGDCEVLA